MIKSIRAFASAAIVLARRPAPEGASKSSSVRRRELEFLHLFHAIKALSTPNKSFVLQFVASVHCEGTSTAASGFVETAATHSRKPVLLIDCTPIGGKAAPFRSSMQSLIDTFYETGAIDNAIQPAPNFPGVMLSRLSGADDGLLNIDSGDLSRLLDLARQAFPIIVLDCSPATEEPESLALARYSDGTVLVVRAEVTPRPLVAETKQSIERFGGQLVGVVFNRNSIYIPRWLQGWV
jgi:Mrp family chromosome partitioning ATPase